MLDVSLQQKCCDSTNPHRWKQKCGRMGIELDNGVLTHFSLLFFRSHVWNIVNDQEIEKKIGSKNEDTFVHNIRIKTNNNKEITTSNEYKYFTYITQ